VRVRQGDFVPADIKIIEGKVEVDQSALTGESQAVIKEDNNILYSGSTIKHGEVSGVVLFTGVDTFFGKTTELVQTASPKLHMQDVISNVVKWLIAIVGVTLSIVVVVSVIRGINIINVLPLILVLLVSAIPVALPAMFTITMALGSLEMAKKGILITRLSASEDAASMDTVCSDKTGTITMNKLIVSTVIPVGDYRDVDVIRYGSLASNESTQDSIDIAFLNYAAEKKVTCEEYTQKKYIPFDPAKRSTEALIEYKGKIIKVSKGAVNELSKRCANPPDVHKNIMDNVTNLAVKGF
jgi:H+-transporting ATPase